MRERFKPRWTGGITRWDGPRCRVQVEGLVRDARNRGAALTLPEPVLRLADAEYQRQFGGSQDFERIQERGGFGLLEVIGLLADAAERRGDRPSEPRASS